MFAVWLSVSSCILLLALVLVAVLVSSQRRNGTRTYPRVIAAAFLGSLLHTRRRGKRCCCRRYLSLQTWSCASLPIVARSR